MAYNEAMLLPIWGRHYARQVGSDHCYVVDHGSTEPIVLPAGMNKLRLPRSPHDDERRAGFVSDLTSALLRYYDWVVYTDVDELVLADPRYFRDLPSFCVSVEGAGSVTAIGLDVQHVPSLEPSLDPEQPIGSQRAWARFTSAMCKPVLTSQPLHWSPGFHSCEHPVTFSRLYMFHLHWADLDLGRTRQAKTRQMSWADDQFGNHQRLTDAAWIDLFQGMANLPRNTEIDLDPGASPLQEWLERTKRSGEGRAGQTFGIDLDLNAPELWSIPSHFRDRL